MREYETIQGEATRLGVSYSTIRRWLAGWRPTAKPVDLIEDGQTVRIRHEGLCEYLRRRKA